ncbi:hypothetical protein [Halobacillus sp. A5]|uniref:hypothetical protein n=1 Tax=Halobacillus sp. A5 TaxID=2880263 RepID=UPI0020A69F46|nr:hypothetical protein [Halobacillus sp. A5]MCP3026527.1 hypothetical protein [Halobacillus sp. A5]
MGDLIPFPKPNVRLSKEEYQRFEELKESMKHARTRAEVNYFYQQAKILIEKAGQRDV